VIQTKDVNYRMLNTENGRIATFNKSHTRFDAFDADWDSGYYEDNHEEVTRSTCWGWGEWENV
jgi:hypothetical protein